MTKINLNIYLHLPELYNHKKKCHQKKNPNCSQNYTINIDTHIAAGQNFVKSSPYIGEEYLHYGLWTWGVQQIKLKIWILPSLHRIQCSVSQQGILYSPRNTASPLAAGAE